MCKVTAEAADITRIRASCVVLAMLSCTVKVDEEDSPYVGLAQENCFGSAGCRG